MPKRKKRSISTSTRKKGVPTSNVRKKGVSTKQIDRIRTLSREGKTANQIQKTMIKEGLSFRRQTMQGYVREFRARPAPSYPSKNVPTKYLTKKEKKEKEKAKKKKAYAKAKAKKAKEKAKAKKSKAKKKKAKKPKRARGAVYKGYQQRWRQRHKRPEGRAQKYVAEYGTVLGEPRRIQVYGHGRQLYEVMMLIGGSHGRPPKHRFKFLEIDANTLLADPDKYLIHGIWDYKPRFDYGD
jgi:hypothetical protein